MRGRHLGWSRWVVVAAIIVGSFDVSGLPADETDPPEAIAETPAVTIEESSETIDESPITDFDRDHWSFLPIDDPAPPEVRGGAWSANGLDRFLLSRMIDQSLQPMPPATRETILRRLKFDLLGLPPTLAEIETFTADDRPDAYERLVDNLLSSPAYGERWAQHWLDLARFAETDGFEHDKLRPDAWRYRQWVIDALNDDMSYDRFVRLQLAGDLTGKERDAVATMFCLAGPDMPDINEQDLRRHDKLNEIASTVGASLLGLQFHCAQCHDHKYDPISQADFYRLRAVFDAAVPVLKRDQAVTQLSSTGQPETMFVYLRGELTHRGGAIEPRPPRVVCAPQAYAAFDADRPREAFADWLLSEDNPLAARVIANRIWQHHFGQSLTENPSDFGIIAAGPTHPELLDYLASRLRRNAWSLKALHRLILTSATYRQSSYPATGEAVEQYQKSVATDPQNVYYSRFPRRRLEGEVIRDAMLAISGRLNRQSGGPSVMPPLPPELLGTLLKNQWRTSDSPADAARRSIYVFARRNLRYPLFEVFDRPDAGASCARRDRSTTAIQSLQLLNSELAVSAAADFRDELLDSHGEGFDVSKTIDELFLCAFGRGPTAIEIDQMAAYLAPSSAADDAAGNAANDLPSRLQIICLAILNANEFVYID